MKLIRRCSNHHQGVRINREIIFNGRFLTQPVSGVQRYAREIVRAADALATERPDLYGPIRLIAPTGTQCDLDLQSIAFSSAGIGGGHAWEQTSLAWLARDANLIGLGNSGPILHPRQVVVIHDAAAYRFPEHFGVAYGLFHRRLEHLLARTSRLCTVSEFSRRELSTVLGIPQRDITVAPNGAEHLSSVEPDNSVFSRLNLDNVRYFLTVGNLTRNKNLSLVAQAIQKMPRSDFRVVVVGRADNTIFGDQAIPNDDRIVLAGRVTDSELCALYSNALALVFPSRYEGFGIPPLEAFMYNCPVIASSISAIQEICGDAVLYFDVDDSDTLMKHLVNTLESQIDRVKMISYGRERAKRYQWRQSAEKLLEATMLDRPKAN